MNIDEMKDRIARAEEIQRYTENRCEALEKENADLERKLEQTEKDLADYQFNYSTIKELEKENAELKEYNKYLKRQRQGGIQKQYNKVAIIKQQDEHLTKAKEIIKRLLATPRSIYGRDEDGEVTSFFNSDYEELEKQAEQFLKEE